MTSRPGRRESQQLACPNPKLEGSLRTRDTAELACHRRSNIHLEQSHRVRMHPTLPVRGSRARCGQACPRTLCILSAPDFSCDVIANSNHAPWGDLRKTIWIRNLPSGCVSGSCAMHRSHVVSQVLPELEMHLEPLLLSDCHVMPTHVRPCR